MLSGTKLLFKSRFRASITANHSTMRVEMVLCVRVCVADESLTLDCSIMIFLMWHAVRFKKYDLNLIRSLACKYSVEFCGLL